MLSDHDRKLLEDIRAQTEKLAAEVRRLHTDVVRLRDRIEPYDNAVTIDGAPIQIGGVGEPPEKWRLVDALNMIAESRREIYDAERHLNAVRGRIDEIASDAYLRDELKPYIKPPSPRQK